MPRVELVLSALPKTWFIDLDGTVLVHNGYMTGKDTVIVRSKEFLDGIPSEDRIVFVTSRGEELRGTTESFLAENGIRYDAILFGMPMGERIVINDAKPSGLKTAYAVNTVRDEGIDYSVSIDKTL